MTYAVQAIRNIMIRNATLSDLLQPITTLVVSEITLYTSEYFGTRDGLKKNRNILNYTID